MDEVEALEGVLLLDAAEEVDAALLARVALDRRALVHDGELFRGARHAERGARDDAHDGEEGARGLPALGAPARVVVQHVGRDGDLDRVRLAVAV